MEMMLGKAPIYRGKGSALGAWTLDRFYPEFELQINEVHLDFTKGDFLIHFGFGSCIPGWSPARYQLRPGS
jgi:hypothetical protein